MKDKRLLIPALFFLVGFIIASVLYNPEKNLEVKHAQAFATMESSKTAAAFMVFNNKTKRDRTLIGAQSDIAEITEIHENLIDPDDGKMMMRKIKTLELPSKKKVALEPSGYHIMFIKMKRVLKAGDTFPLTLMFENGEEKTIDVKVTPPGQMHH